MSKDDDEQDPREGPLHPRHAQSLLGHDAAERRLVDAYRSGRFHHAWLLTGPKGIGKATLAYRLAKYMLLHPDPTAAPRDSLAVPQADHVAAQVEARAHPDLKIVEKIADGGKLKTVINVETSRKVGDFFSKTAGAGGWRVAIVDAAEDMNLAAANALLKTLEEPPARSVFIIVCHQPGRLLRTIRSRCIELPMARLSLADTSAVLEGLPDGAGREALKLTSIAQGSPGLALSLAETGAGAVFARFAEAAQRGRIDGGTRFAVANALHGRGTEDRFASFCELLDGWLANAAATAARSPGSAATGLALAEAHDAISRSIRETNSLNLDRRLTLLQAFEQIDKARRA
jgi:DNA polymerase-3 subunit delta'